MMKLLISTIALSALLALSQGAQVAEYLCRYTAGNPKQFEFHVTKDGSAATDIQNLYGPGGCSIGAYTAGTATVIAVVDAAGTPITPVPCGISEALGVYTLTIRTSSCPNCLVDYDYEYAIDCDFAVETTAATELVSASGTTVTDSLITGTATAFAEDITLKVIASADSSDVTGTVALGTDVKLRATLAISSTAGYATGVELITCTADDGGSYTVDIFDANGCTETGLGIIAPNLGFDKNAGVSDGSNYVSDSPSFPTFLFPDRGTNVLFKCFARFCYGGTNTECDTSCIPPARRRRSANRYIRSDNVVERNIRVMLTVSTDNTTQATLRHLGSDNQMSECSSRSYVIGLAILGCVLALTCIVTIGMFVIFRRRHGNPNDKMSYDNKSVS